MKWVVIVLALLVVLALIPAFVGSGTKSRKQAKAAHKTVARGPGSRAHPIPVRRSASVGGGWKLKVVSATPNATRLVLKADSSAKSPARGGQDFMLFVAATYTSGGKSRFGGSGLPSFTDQLFAVGKHRAIYRLTTGLSACGPSSVHLPKPDAQGNGEDIFSGQSVRGNICFEIASNDASTLKLYVERPYNESNKPIVWFALR